jgi:hypothetical protein
MAKSKSSSGGISFLVALGLLFIGLKLGGAIDWSWWYVTMPLWGGLAIVLAVLLFAGVIVGATGAFTVASAACVKLWRKVADWRRK